MTFNSEGVRLIMEKTLVLVKPDAMERGICKDILDMYTSMEGVTMIDQKELQATEEMAKAHYAEHCERPFFKELISFITRSPIHALVLEGEDVIKRVRDLNGATDPKEAKEGTIRAKFADSKNENCVHASDSVESAEREMNIWFR